MTIKRPLVFIAGGFVLGEVLALLPVTIRIGVLAGCFCRGFWCCAGKKSGRELRVWLLLLFCCACGMLRMSLELAEKPWEGYLAAAGGRTVEIQGEVRGIAEKEKSVGLTLGRCVMIGDEEESRMPDMLVYVDPVEFAAAETKGPAGDGEDSAPVRIGMRVSVWGKPEKPERARNPGEFDFRMYYRAKGIWYQMFGSDFEVVDGRYRPYADGLWRLGLAGKELLGRLCEPSDRGIFQAAILGDPSAMDEQVRELYQRNGIAHLLAISGLHISLVGMLLYRILRRLGMGYGLAGSFGALVIVSYGYLTGASASVVRAVVMVLVMMLAEYLGRNYDMLSAAALAGLLLLAKSPYLFFQAGFQLSFGAVAAIGGLGPWLAGVWKVKSGPAQALLMGIAIQLVTYPILLYHFFQYPVYGVFLNLLVIPLMQYVILSGLSGLLLGAVHEGLGIAMLGSGHYILQFYFWLCTRMDGLPSASLIIGRPQLWQIGVYYGLLAMMLWGMARFGRMKFFWGLAVGTGCFFVLWKLPGPGLTVAFLDVGQGDGICIQTGSGVILVDGGSSSEKDLGKYSLEPYLKSQGISQVDYAVVSHGDGDHISGLMYLLEQEKGIRIRHLILPWLGQGTEGYEELIRLMERHGGDVHWMQEGERIVSGGLAITCLFHGEEEKRQEMNEHSLGLRLDYGNLEVFLTGDMSSEGEKAWMEDEEAGNCGGSGTGEKSGIRILKIAHHGSKYSTSREFLQKIRPDYAVVSYGEGNSYGHPHEEVLERLEKEGIPLWKTGISGAVILSSDGTNLWVEEMIDSDASHPYNKE